MRISSSEALNDYLKWRELVFSVTSGQVEDMSDLPDRAYGVIMDVGLSNDFIITVTAFATGESSLRTTIGGGAIGLGGDKLRAEYAKQITTMAQSLIKTTRLITNHSLPKKKKSIFTFLLQLG
jgi:hypothetical protein